MGIHNLNKFLKQEFPNTFRKVPITSFKNTRVAIDTNLILYKYFAKAYSNVIASHLNDIDDINNYFSAEQAGHSSDDEENFYLKNNLFIYKKVLSEVCSKVNNLIEFFLKYDILPIFVLDGVSVLEKNEYAHVRRTKAVNSTKDKMFCFRDNIAITSNTPQKINIENFKKKAQNCPPVNKIKGFNDFNILKRYIKNVLKIPFLIAPNESEKYCSYLSRIKFVSAVYTTDTDCFAFGASLIITEIDFIKKIFHVSQPSVILNKLNITQETFVDFCIMLGCDFNEKVEGIGYNGLWHYIEKNNLLKMPNLIENLEKYYKDKDFKGIEKERCRYIFLNFDECKKSFEKHSLTYSKRYKMKDFCLKDFLLERKKDFVWDSDDYHDVKFYE